MKEEDLLLMKVPQVIIARKLPIGDGFAENETYLNAAIFIKQFYEPTIEILAPCLHGFIFEQEYHVKNDRVPIKNMAGD